MTADERALRRRAGGAPLLPEAYEERERIVALLSGVNRRGSWEPAGRISVLALWGGAKLDFREADLLEGETVVDVLAIMGGVEILVPRDIDVEVRGSAVMGGFEQVHHRADAEDAPLLRIEGMALMGGVEVKLK